MAYTVVPGISGSGSTAGDDPLQTAVWRLRSRGCWVDAAALLEPHAGAAGPALQRASLLVERCLYTGHGWAEAEDALRTAEATAHGDEERGAAASERGHLAYASSLLRVHDRTDEARAALGRAAALLEPDAPGRALLDFRRGLVAENLAEVTQSAQHPQSPQSARGAYVRAHAAAKEHGDALLLSFTSRHLAGLALRRGEVAEARRGFAESLRLREELGYLIGTAPALMSLADTEQEPEAGRLRAEAERLVRLLGGVPSWLANRLTPPFPLSPPSPA